MTQEDPDPFGQAIRHWYQNTQTNPLYTRDGTTVLEHPIERFYFEPFDPTTESGAWVTNHLQGPLLDLGAGAGRHALYFQDQFETVALESSDALVETMRDRGVSTAVSGNMFDLRRHFDPNRFGGALSIGTQLGLATSDQAIREFLDDLATITTGSAMAVLDSYDPRHPECPNLLGWRTDPDPEIGYRVFHFEYQDVIGETLLFRFVTPDRFRRIVIETPWEIDCFRGGAAEDIDQWRVALSKPE